MTTTKTRILFLNHSSLLISYGDEYVYTDPFYAHPAFETWLPVPPMYIHPAYLAAISRSTPNFSIMISHGHDDHCDDKLLGLFRHCRAYISPFDSPGLRNRLKRIGFETIVELSETPMRAGVFDLSAFINREFSLDDSIQVVTAPDLSVVHANDCWWPLLEEHREAIAGQLKPRGLYASQVAIADGYPLAYSCFSDEEKRERSDGRVRKHIGATLTNAAGVGAQAFLHYAGHVKIFSENDQVNAGSGFVSNRFIRENAPPYVSIEVLDMVPGDTYEDGKVTLGLGRQLYTEDAMKAASVDYWKAYGELRYKNPGQSVTHEWLRERLEIFASEFRGYVEKTAVGKGFRQDILHSRIIFHIDGVAKEDVVFSQYSDPGRIDLEVTFSPVVAGQVLSGALNFEACYIGCLGSFSVTPKTHYNGHAVRWLNMFGYVWINRILATLA